MRAHFGRAVKKLKREYLVTRSCRTMALFYAQPAAVITAIVAATLLRILEVDQNHRHRSNSTATKIFAQIWNIHYFG